MNHPTYTLLLVDDPRASGRFYADLLGVEPVDASDTFVLFALQGGLMLGLWSRHTVTPPPGAGAGGAEGAATLGGGAAGVLSVLDRESMAAAISARLSSAGSLLVWSFGSISLSWVVGGILLEVCGRIRSRHFYGWDRCLDESPSCAAPTSSRYLP